MLLHSPNGLGRKKKAACHCLHNQKAACSMDSSSLLLLQNIHICRDIESSTVGDSNFISSPAELERKETWADSEWMFPILPWIASLQIIFRSQVPLYTILVASTCSDNKEAQKSLQINREEIMVQMAAFCEYSPAFCCCCLELPLYCTGELGTCGLYSARMRQSGTWFRHVQINLYCRIVSFPDWNTGAFTLVGFGSIILIIGLTCTATRSESYRSPWRRMRNYVGIKFRQRNTETCS
jgi:hypothetical protein